MKTPKSKEIQPEHVFQVYYTSTEKWMLILYNFLVLTAPLARFLIDYIYSQGQ